MNLSSKILVNKEIQITLQEQFPELSRCGLGTNVPENQQPGIKERTTINKKFLFQLSSRLS